MTHISNGGKCRSIMLRWLLAIAVGDVVVVGEVDDDRLISGVEFGEEGLAERNDCESSSNVGVLCLVSNPFCILIFLIIGLMEPTFRIPYPRLDEDVDVECSFLLHDNVDSLSGEEVEQDTAAEALSSPTASPFTESSFSFTLCSSSSNAARPISLKDVTC